MAASFEKILEAYEFVSFDTGLGEHEAFLCKESGKIYWRFGEGLDDPDDPDIEKLPDDIEDGEKYLAIPGKRDLDLGTPLVFDFARDVLPDDYDEIRRIFDRRGAYARFKELLIRRRALDRWYDFENQATERALREWCADNMINLAD